MKSKLSFAILTLFAIISCTSDKKKVGENDFSYDEIRIAWDYSSMIQFAESGGYPRLLRLQDNSIAVALPSMKTITDCEEAHGAKQKCHIMLLPDLSTDAGNQHPFNYQTTNCKYIL